MRLRFANRYSILILKPAGKFLYRLIDFKTGKVIDQGFGAKELDRLRKKKTELETEEPSTAILKEVTVYPTTRC